MKNRHITMLEIIRVKMEHIALPAIQDFKRMNFLKKVELSIYIYMIDIKI
jgi:hypothetical protein